MLGTMYRKWLKILHCSLNTDVNNSKHPKAGRQHLNVNAVFLFQSQCVGAWIHFDSTVDTKGDDLTMEY